MSEYTHLLVRHEVKKKEVNHNEKCDFYYFLSVKDIDNQIEGHHIEL